MSGATFALMVNTSLALMVAASFYALARSSPAPGICWFAASFATGAGTSFSELLVGWSGFPAIFVFLSFATFSLAFHIMAAGLARYYTVDLPKWLLPLSFTASLAGRLVFWNAPRGALLYEFAYQVPFTAALAICTAILLRGAPPRWLDRTLTLMFALSAAHFLAKPFLSVWLGAGATAGDYVDSRYAIVSQSMTAIALIATALALILVVVRDALEAARRSADIDELSGLANRRAFDRGAIAILRRDEGGSRAVGILFDLDHFKAINDTHGHAAGDDVIRAFARTLREILPKRAIIGRIGGEEFAALLPATGSVEAQALAEQVLSRFAIMAFSGSDGPFRASASSGLAVSAPGETLQAVMIRCDRALYRAKAEGRDRIVVAG